ncbi:U3 small nucleolar RNA-associated protein 14 like protein A [Cucumispora dikerogammari]|nr:U3 small nucleolar RNA-associated protein 14 like protein A [Cucumispora dikerogammari]
MKYTKDTINTNNSQTNQITRDEQTNTFQEEIQFNKSTIISRKHNSPPFLSLNKHSNSGGAQNNNIDTRPSLFTPSIEARIRSITSKQSSLIRMEKIVQSQFEKKMRRIKNIKSRGGRGALKRMRLDKLLPDGDSNSVESDSYTSSDSGGGNNEDSPVDNKSETQKPLKRNKPKHLLNTKGNEYINTKTKECSTFGSLAHEGVLSDRTPQLSVDSSTFSSNITATVAHTDTFIKDFIAEKQQTIEEQSSKTKTIILPGWNEWGNLNIPETSHSTKSCTISNTVGESGSHRFLGTSTTAQNTSIQSSYIPDISTVHGPEAPNTLTAASAALSHTVKPTKHNTLTITRKGILSSNRKDMHTPHIIHNHNFSTRTTNKNNNDERPGRFETKLPYNTNISEYKHMLNKSISKESNLEHVFEKLVNKQKGKDKKNKNNNRGNGENFRYFEDHNHDKKRRRNNCK